MFIFTMKTEEEGHYLFGADSILEVQPPKSLQNDVVFDFPPSSFKGASFSSIADLKKAIRSQESSLKASFSFSSNSRYVSLRCKTPHCLSHITYKILRGRR